MTQYAPLRVPLNKLLYMHPDNIDKFDALTRTEINSIKDDYSHKEIQIIGNAVISACNNNDIDFLALMPELQQRNYSNEQAANYLHKIKPVFIALLAVNH